MLAKQQKQFDDPVESESRNANGNITPAKHKQNSLNLKSANTTIIKSNNLEERENLKKDYQNQSGANLSHLKHFSIENPHSMTQY